MHSLVCRSRCGDEYKCIFRMQISNLNFTKCGSSSKKLYSPVAGLVSGIQFVSYSFSSSNFISETVFCITATHSYPSPPLFSVFLLQRWGEIVAKAATQLLQRALKKTLQSAHCHTKKRHKLRPKWTVVWLSLTGRAGVRQTPDACYLNPICAPGCTPCGGDGKAVRLPDSQAHNRHSLAPQPERDRVSKRNI